MSERPDFSIEFSPTTDPLDPAPSWVDVAGRSRGFSSTIGRQQILEAFQPGTAVVEVDNGDRRFDPAHAAGPYAGDLLPGKRLRIRGSYGATGLVVDAGASGTATTPAPAWTPGDLDLIVDAELVSWAPAGTYIIAAQADLAGGVYGWLLVTNGTGIELRWSPDGTLGSLLTVATGIIPDAGSRNLLRATLDVNNGAGGHDWALLESLDDGASWSELAGATVAGVTSIADTDEAISIGEDASGTIFSFEARDGIDGDALVAPRFTNGQRFLGGATSGTDRLGNVWTLTGGATLPARTSAIFGGFVDGWPVADGTLGRAPIPATDGFRFLVGSAPAGEAPFETALGALEPVHWWKLDDPVDSPEVADHGSDPTPVATRGTAGAGLGADGLLSDGSDATALLNSGKGWLDFDPGYAWSTMVAVVKIPTVSFSDQALVSDGIAGRTLLVRGSTSGFSGQVQAFDASGSFRSSSRVDDDLPHVIVAVRTGVGTFALYLDGAAMAGTAAGGSTGGVVRATLLAGSGTPGNGPVAGTVQHLAMYDRALTADEIAGIADARVGWAGDTIDERIERLLDLADWPSSEREIDSSEAGLLAVAEVGADVLTDLRVLEESEGGALYQTPDFSIRFRSRYSTVTGARSRAVRYTFTDEAGPEKFRFSRIVIPGQGEWIRNRVLVGWVDGTVVVESASSIDDYGAREHSIETVLTSEAQARSLGELIIARYAEPVDRVSELVLDLAAEPIGWEPALGLEIGDRVAVRWTPGDVGDPIVVEALVDGITIDAGRGWEDDEATIRLSAADALDFWLWDESQWEIGTRWG